MVESKAQSLSGPSCGPYTIIRTLGVGGNAVVKLAEKDGVKYALKIFLMGGQDQQEVIEKTKEEFDVVKGLNIDGVMKYYDFAENATWTNRKGQSKQVCYLVMELLDGVELLEFLNEAEGLDDSILRYVFLQIANAVHQLHKAGIAHRDIKPENVMLTEDFEIKLIDLGFGLALAGRTGTSWMKTRKGTLMYMAPEIIDRATYYQGQDADCFALGVSLFVGKFLDYPWAKPDIDDDADYRLLAGDNGTNADAFWAKYEGEAPTEDFKDLIEGSLAYNPTTRPTMVDILGHRWMRGKVCTKEQFAAKCKPFMQAAIDEKKAANEGFGIDHAVDRVRRSDKQWEQIAKNLVDVPFRPDFARTTTGRVKRFIVQGIPLEVMKLLYEACKKHGGAEASETKWKLTIPCSEGQADEAETFKMQIELHELDQNKQYVVSVSRKGGSEMAHRAFNAAYKKLIEHVKEEDENN